eukprot:6188289-Pleurochrysis_carterae.AAC.4
MIAYTYAEHRCALALSRSHESTLQCERPCPRLTAPVLTNGCEYETSSAKRLQTSRYEKARGRSSRRDDEDTSKIGGRAPRDSVRVDAMRSCVSAVRAGAWSGCALVLGASARLVVLFDLGRVAREEPLPVDSRVRMRRRGVTARARGG